MKSAIAGIIFAVALASAAVAVAGPSAKPQASTVDIAALQKKLNATNARVNKLETRVNKLETTQKLLVDVAVTTLAGLACDAALTADAFQSTWATVDVFAQAVQMRTYFSAPTLVNDQKSCSDLGVPRQPPVPASVASFPKLIDLFYAP
jgi:hypothetical protein